MSVSFAAFALSACSHAPAGPAPAEKEHRFRVAGDHFELDGRPFQIRSGELHYARIPRAYWRDRLRKARALGLNAVTTYVFWNQHEASPGAFDFSGEKDVAEFVREAQEEGLYVILRPGPYVCAELDLGGYPPWLLRDHDAVLRSSDPRHLGPVRRWLRELGRQLAPLQIDRGGPILLVQLENEYGSVHQDLNYVLGLRQALLDAGFTGAMMDMVNPPERLPDGALPGIFQAVNFGIGHAREAFAALAKAQPAGPRMAGEYWTGWYDSWGLPHHRGPTEQMLDDLAWMTKQGYSFSFYMLHGGTTFGWYNGASPDPEKGFYSPYVNSYDYDAPLDERGAPTAKYWAIRKLLAAQLPETLPAPPAGTPAAALPPIRPAGSLSLWRALPAPVRSPKPLSMEDLGQGYGYILYRTQLHGPQRGDLVLTQLHDYARVYLDGKPVGALERRLRQDRLRLVSAKPTATLDILVENAGRMNYTDEMRAERKGITEKVELGGRELLGWEIYPLPMTGVAALPYAASAACRGACFYEARFEVSRPADTFLDTRGLGKGMVFVNGRPLGRFFTAAGPQATLFLPASWLRAGENKLQVFDLDGRPGWAVPGRAEAILDASER